MARCGPRRSLHGRWCRAPSRRDTGGAAGTEKIITFAPRSRAFLREFPRRFLCKLAISVQGIHALQCFSRKKVPVPYGTPAELCADIRPSFKRLAEAVSALPTQVPTQVRPYRPGRLKMLPPAALRTQAGHPRPAGRKAIGVLRMPAEARWGVRSYPTYPAAPSGLSAPMADPLAPGCPAVPTLPQKLSGVSVRAAPTATPRPDLHTPAFPATRSENPRPSRKHGLGFPTTTSTICRLFETDLIGPPTRLGVWRGTDRVPPRRHHRDTHARVARTSMSGSAG